MHKVYAIEPSALHSWDRVRFVADSVGFDQGRLVADLPDSAHIQWAKSVHESCSESETDLNLKRIEERLKQLMELGVVIRGDYRPWNAAKGWPENACRLAKAKHNAIDAVIVDSVDDETPKYVMEVTHFADLDKRRVPWKCTRQTSCRRDAKELARVAARLLNSSKNIIFIDPFFDPGQSTFLKPLAEFLRVAFDGRRDVASIKVCYQVDGLKWQGKTPDRFANDCWAHLAGLLPRGHELRLQRLLPAAERLHDRYLLTELGGIEFGSGLQTGDSRTTVRLVDEGHRDELWRIHVDGLAASESFKLLDNDSITIVGTGT